MKWRGRRQSDNVDDRRGMSGGKLVAGGGVIGIIILLISMFGGENAQMLMPVLEQMNQQSAPVTQRELTDKEMEEGAFIKTLMADNEDVWTKILRKTD